MSEHAEPRSMATTENAYREHVPIYEDVWDWDIVLVHGNVKVIGTSFSHLDHCAWKEYGANCRCGEGPKLSSPVVDKNGRQLSDGAPYSVEPKTGDGKLYIDAGPGSEIPVMSGKTYRLNGPRGHHDGFAPGSIWVVYAEPEPTPEPDPTLLDRLFSWIWR